MKLNFKIYIAAAVVITAAITAVWLWSEHRVTKLERDVEAAKAAAGEHAALAAEKERQASEYRAKSEYLEQKVIEIRSIAKKQDEELKTLSNNVDTARRDVHRARRTRTDATTAGELCAKLAELNHPCR